MNKILHLCYSDHGGGADRAAMRLCQAQRRMGLDAHLLVVKKGTDHPYVHGAVPGWRRLAFKVKDRLAQKLIGMQPLENTIMHTLNVFPSFLDRTINRSDFDIVNLHWVGKEMISVAEIGRIRKPVVWTCHDSWAFCGAEHHPDGPDDVRYQNGYEDGGLLDVNRWNWQRKANAWKKKRFHVVAPSHWEAGMALKSKLFGGQPVAVIPNPLDTDLFKPADKREARARLNLPQDKKIILFGSMRSVEDKNKGMDLLRAALKVFKQKHGVEQAQAVIFGMSEGEEVMPLDFPRQYTGKIRDDGTIALLYAAADVMVVPSRMENLPQTATEPLACGTPVAAFHIGGLPDIITHQQNGYLARPYDPADLCEGIAWLLNHPDPAWLAQNARQRALEQFSEPTVVAQYLDVYRQAIREARQQPAAV